MQFCLARQILPQLPRPYRLRYPIPVIFIPVPVAVASQALFTHLRRVHFAVAAPTPAHRAQVETAGWLITNRANLAVGQPFAAILPSGDGVFVAEVTMFYGHKE